MSEKYELYKQKKYRQAVQKLTNLVTQKKISRTQLIAFLNRHGEKVLKRESTADIINRISNRFSLTLDYFIDDIKEIKAIKLIKPRKQQPKSSSNANKMKAILDAKAFMGAYQSYAIKPIEENKYNYSNLISDSRLTIKKTLDATLAKLHGLKVKLSFKGWFSVGKMVLRIIGLRRQ